MDQFLNIKAERLTREEVVRFLPMAGFDFASEELQAEVDAFNADLAKVNADHCACCKSIDDALANLAKAPDAAELRKAVGQRADNTLSDVQKVAKLWGRRVELVSQYRQEIERAAEAAKAKADEKTAEVMSVLGGLGFDVDRPTNQSGFNYEVFVNGRHPEARQLHTVATRLNDLHRSLPQRYGVEKRAAAHAESYVRSVAESYVAGKL